MKKVSLLPVPELYPGELYILGACPRRRPVASHGNAHLGAWLRRRYVASHGNACDDRKLFANMRGQVGSTAWGRVPISARITARTQRRRAPRRAGGIAVRAVDAAVPRGGSACTHMSHVATKSARGRQVQLAERRVRTRACHVDVEVARARTAVRGGMQRRIGLRKALKKASL